MWARIEENRVLEITDINPVGRFHPSIEWVACSKEAGVGWQYKDGEFSPPIPEPGPTTEQLADTARSKRDRLIESVRWRIERHNDEVALDAEPTESLEPLLQYTQALRDVPQQTGFPESVVWPPCP